MSLQKTYTRNFGRDWASRIDKDFLGSPEQFSSLPWVVRVISTGMAPKPTSNTSSSSASHTAPDTSNAYLSEADNARFRRLQRRKIRKQKHAVPQPQTDPSDSSTTASDSASSKAEELERQKAARESRLLEDRALLVQQADVVSASAAQIVSTHGQQLGE